jgi:hypothetical protein
MAAWFLSAASDKGVKVKPRSASGQSTTWVQVLGMLAFNVLAWRRFDAIASLGRRAVPPSQLCPRRTARIASKATAGHTNKPAEPPARPRQARHRLTNALSGEGAREVEGRAAESHGRRRTTWRERGGFQDLADLEVSRTEAGRISSRAAACSRTSGWSSTVGAMCGSG